MNIREGFEDHIAKQQKLEGVPKAVLAVQVFSMKENLDYTDDKLQTMGAEWRSASSQQLEKDAKWADYGKTICKWAKAQQIEKDITILSAFLNKEEDKVGGIIRQAINAIRNQATRSEDQENE